MLRGALALIVYAQAGYGVVLAALRRVGVGAGAPRAAAAEPMVSVIVAAYQEEATIAGRVENLLALDWPRERLQIVVASDGSTDGTVAAARAAGADVVLDLARAGKVRTQDAGVDAATGDLLAFGDANARWAPDALRRLVAPFADPAVGYACGRVTFLAGDGGNQEGLYWRYEMALRAMESDLWSVTAGNGAIYAVRPEAYLRLDARVSHDLAFPFNLVRRGWRAVDVADAGATEKMVPTVEGEWRRKRRMMAHAWPMIATGGLLDPRGQPPLYAWMVLSHRGLRYATPLLHVVALVAAARRSRVLFVAQLLFLLAAALGGERAARPLLVARYYTLTQASIAAGLYDWLRHGTPAGWEAAEGTR